MVGKGVLIECLDSAEVTQVISIGRRTTDIEHSKLQEIQHGDFLDFSPIVGDLGQIDACYHCMGVSAAGLSEEDYTKMTYDFSMSLAQTMLEINPRMTITYVSGQGTDSSEKGRTMWARVKGKTENDILKMGFKQAFAFRPGGIIPRKGVVPSSKLYRVAITYLGWLLWLIKKISPSSVVDSDQIGQAMINATLNGHEKTVIEPRDILALAVGRERHQGTR